MNTIERFKLTEEDLAKESSRPPPKPLPILNRIAAVVADADHANSNRNNKDSNAKKDDTTQIASSSSSSSSSSTAKTFEKDMSSTTTIAKQKSPVVVIVVGMAGSGKSTLMAQLQRSLRVPVSHDGNNTNMAPISSSKEKDVDEDKPETTTNKDTVVDEDVPTYEEEEEDTRRIGYCLNLDPATKLMPFAASIDIRDTVDYKEVMLQHQLGPNGAIMTSLNLFATKFDQVIQILEQRAFPPSPPAPPATSSSASSSASSSSTNATTPSFPPCHPNQDPSLDFILVDTPGQIEAFTWSASGTIMTSALASSFPTILAFVVDTPRCAASPSTFMSNMLYACSMLYRTRLPVLVVFNKIDVVPHDFCVDWMTDYESFQEALDDASQSGGGGSSSESGYYGSLTRSLSMMLDEFYSTLTHVGVSAATGDGVEEFWEGVEQTAREFETGYLVDLKQKMEEQEVKKRVVQRESMRRLRRDLKRQSK